jgi:fructokinase
MRIGIDVGGTKIEGIALDPAGAERARRRVSTPHDYPATVSAVTELVRALEAEADARGTVGVGIPGALSPATGLVKNANATWINGRPLDADLRAALGRPVRIANDANCFAVSEATDGAGAGAEVVFGVILGTGVGGGLVVRGRALTGAGAIAGEWGHNPLPWPTPAERPGPPCYCGRTGCIESFLSGPALTRDLQAASGRTLDPAAIGTAAEAGDPEAGAALARYGERLGRALATVINLLDPDVIVLGGGLSRLHPLYTTAPEAWRSFVFGGETATRLLPNRHGDASGVRGAAWLWPAAAERR